MNDTNEGRIRSYLDQQGGSAQVPFHNLMTTWRVQYATEADCRRIEDALRSAGVVTQPPLTGLSPDSLVWLQVAAVQAPPTPWGGPPTPPAPSPPPAPQQPPAPAPPPQTWGGPQAQPGAPYAAPPAPPRFVPQAAPAAAAGVPEVNTTALAIGAAAAVLALIASFLPWVSAFDEGSSLWELAEILDVLLALFAVGTLGAVAATFASSGARVLQILTIGLMGGLLSFVLVPPIEFIVSGEGDVSGTQAGEIVGLLAAVGLGAAVAMLILDICPPHAALPRGQEALLLLAGLGLLAFAGLAQPFVALLPFQDDMSTWESSEVYDVLTSLIGLGLAAAAGAAIAGLARPPLVAAAFALGAYIGVGSLAGGIEALAADGDTGIAVYLLTFLIGPAALVGAGLVARGSNLLSLGTQR